MIFFVCLYVVLEKGVVDSEKGAKGGKISKMQNELFIFLIEYVVGELSSTG